MGKIDKVKLYQMLRLGKPVKECAKYFSVTPGAISQAKKEINLGVVKSVTLENAHRVVSKNLDAVTQLQMINQRATALLDLAEGDNDRATVLGVMREIRCQLKLQLDIFQCLYDMKAVQEFQAEVLTAIGEASSDVRDKIIRRLNEKHAIRAAVKFN
jgi:hypothetical protein